MTARQRAEAILFGALCVLGAGFLYVVGSELVAAGWRGLGLP